MKKLFRWALLIVALGIFSGCGGDDNNVSVVQQLVAFGTTVGTADLGASNLVRLNPATGEYLSTVGSTGYWINGLAFDKTTGKLFATTATQDPTFPSGLIEINITTGAGTEIGPLGLPNGEPAVSLTVDASGQLYAWHEPGVDSLVKIDKTTGAATAVGPSGIGTSTLGLDFDASGTLFLVNWDGSTYTINTTTGAATLVGSIGVTAHHGKFHPGTGDFIGIDVADYTVAARNLIAADLSTFTVLDTVPTADYLHAISFGYILLPVVY